MQTKRLRNIIISVFVLICLAVFHYESTRAFYLEPFAHRALPKVKFIFPPAGWIMFYRVDDDFGCAQVYGVKNATPRLIDPHDILRTRSIGYDNIHRNVLSNVLAPELRQPFCAFLKRKFPAFDSFFVTQVYYPSLSRDPYEKKENLIYRCQTQK